MKYFLTKYLGLANIYANLKTLLPNYLSIVLSYELYNLCFWCCFEKKVVKSNNFCDIVFLLDSEQKCIGFTMFFFGT